MYLFLNNMEFNTLNIKSYLYLSPDFVNVPFIRRAKVKFIYFNAVYQSNMIGEYA